MNNWVLLTVLYAILISFYQCSKKKAIEKNSIYEVLALFSTLSFLLSFFISKDVFNINYIYSPIILTKSLIIVVSWILALKAMENMQLSIFGIIKISSIIFSVLLSYIFLNESITFVTIIGISIIITGLILVNKTTNKEKNKKNDFKAIFLLLLSCFLSSISAILDKILLKHITCSQLQFYFLLFLMVSYWIILIIKKRKISIKKIYRNYWILISSVCLVFGDRLLFLANANKDSKVIIMTMLKQISMIITIILGKIMFNEKEIIKKILYSLLIILGILLLFIF